MPTHICRHLHVNGRRCGSPALAAHAFCYFHAQAGKRHRREDTPTVIHPMDTIDGRQLTPIEIAYYAPVEGPLQLDFPPLEDRESIQVAISMLVTAMAANRIDLKRANAILYGLQVASTNAARLDLHPDPSRMATETVPGEDGNPIAPDEDPEYDVFERDLLHSILDRQDRLADPGRNEDEEEEDDPWED